MAETKEQLVEENEALRARVRELEAEVKRSSTRPRVFDRQTSDTLRDLPTEAIDQASRVLRAVSLAAVESTRNFGEVVTGFAEEILTRNTPANETRPRNLAMNLPRDVVAAGVNAVDRSFRLHQRVVDRFSESFAEVKTPKTESKASSES
jgi:hypothetical protein